MKKLSNYLILRFSMVFSTYQESLSNPLQLSNSQRKEDILCIFLVRIRVRKRAITDDHEYFLLKCTARGESRPEFPILCIQYFNPHSNTCTWLPSSDDRKLRDMFLYNDKLYALFLFCKRTPMIFPEASVYHFKKRSGFFTTKYNEGSN